MDFNKVFEQMFNNQSNEGGNFNPMQYADALRGLGSGTGNGFLLIILLLLLCCCGCGNFGYGGYGGSGGCNNQCYEVCCRRKKHRCKKFKNYECYLNPCSCNSCCNNGGYGGCGCGWIWIIILIAVLFRCGKGGKSECANRSSSECASNIINVDTAE